jgi:hypothetical protein
MVQQFPSLMFVRRIPYQTSAAGRFATWRCSACAWRRCLLIIGAFARPFLWRPNAATAIGPGAREVVVLLDQSYSMAYGDRWDRAKGRGAQRDQTGWPPPIVRRSCSSRRVPTSRCGRRPRRIA